MEYMDLKVLSNYLKISKETVYRMLKKGEIPHLRVGKLYRFKKQDIDAWLDFKRRNCELLNEQ